MKKPKGTNAGGVPASTADYRYRLDEFISSGSDDKGQSVRVFFRTSPATERALEIIRDGRIFPYKTIPDIVRHAVDRHLEWLHTMEPDMPRQFFAAMQAINEVCRDRVMHSEMEHTFKKLDTLVDSLLARGEEEEAKRLLSAAKGQLAKVPDSTWKREFVATFATKYARYAVVASAPTPRNVLEFPLPASLSGQSGPSGDSEVETDADDVADTTPDTD